MTRDEALAEFRASRAGAVGVNPFTVFGQGWDAHDDANTDGLADAWDDGAKVGAAAYDLSTPVPNPHRPSRAFPRHSEVRSSGWSVIP